MGVHSGWRISGWNEPPAVCSQTSAVAWAIAASQQHCGVSSMGRYHRPGDRIRHGDGVSRTAVNCTREVGMAAVSPVGPCASHTSAYSGLRERTAGDSRTGLRMTRSLSSRVRQWIPVTLRDCGLRAFRCSDLNTAKAAPTAGVLQEGEGTTRIAEFRRGTHIGVGVELNKVDWDRLQMSRSKPYDPCGCTGCWMPVGLSSTQLKESDSGLNIAADPIGPPSKSARRDPWFDLQPGPARRSAPRSRARTTSACSARAWRSQALAPHESEAARRDNAMRLTQRLTDGTPINPTDR